MVANSADSLKAFYIMMVDVKKIVRLWVMVIPAGILSLASCKSAKTIQTAMNKKDTAVITVMSDTGVDSAAVIHDLLFKVHKSVIDFTSFNGKIKVDYTDQSGKTQGATVFVRMRKDSLMWISLTGTLGVEGFRALVKPDSVWVLDKLEKTITRRSIASLQELTGLPLDFGSLQDLLVGNPVYFSGNIVSYENNGNLVTALSIGEFFKHLLTLDTISNTITQSKIDDVEASRNRTCFVQYADYQALQGRNFSTKREVTVTEKSSLNIKLEYKTFVFDEQQTFPFSIPKSYKEK